MLDSLLLYKIMLAVKSILKTAPDQLQKILFYFLPNNILKIVVTDGISLFVCHLDNVAHGQPHSTQVLIDGARVNVILQTLKNIESPAAIAWFHGTMTICAEDNMVTFETEDNTGGLFPDWEKLFDPERHRTNDDIKIDLTRLSTITTHLVKINHWTIFEHYEDNEPIKLITKIPENQGVITVFIMSMNK